MIARSHLLTPGSFSRPMRLKVSRMSPEETSLDPGTLAHLSSNRRIAEQWRDSAWLPLEWRKAPSQAGTVDVLIEGSRADSTWCAMSFRDAALT